VFGHAHVLFEVVNMPGAKIPPGTGARAHTARPAAGSRGIAAPKPRSASNGAPEFTWPEDPFQLTEYGDVRPKTVDWKTRAALVEAERLLGYRLTIVQGSYNAGGVSASAGTHDKGGVIDLLAFDSRRKVKALRKVGFAAWYRPRLPGHWEEHIHAVLVDHGNLADVAKRQVAAYRDGRDGLKSNALDPSWRPPDPVPVFKYPPDPVAPAAEPKLDSDPLEPLGAAFPLLRSMDGVDTSHHQAGRIDVKAAQAAGVRWWYAKATEGTSFIDPSYRKRMRAARAAGIPVGAYHFARPDGGDAAAEARFFLEHADIRLGDMRPMLDLEKMEDLSLDELTAWTGTWVTTVKRALAANGLAAKPIIYTRFNLTDGFGCMLWVARYSNEFQAPVIPRPWARAAIWQHSNGKIGPVKNVPGFGPVDTSAMHPEVPLSALRIRPIAKPAPAPGPGPVTGPTPEAPAPMPTPTPTSAPTAGPAPEPTPVPTALTAEPQDVAAARAQLLEAAQSIQAALAALPEE